MKDTFNWLALALVLLISGCDPTQPLFLRNGCAEDITIKTTFSGGVVEQAVLEPGQRLAYVHVPSDTEFENVSVFVGGARIHSLSRADLSSLLKSVESPRQTTWNIELQGIRPLSVAEFKRLKHASTP